MVPDTRSYIAITAADHAVAIHRGESRLVRGIDRFTHLPTRQRAAVVWVAGLHGMPGHHTLEVPLADITIHPGSQS